VLRRVPAGDAHALAAAITQAIASEPDLFAAARLSKRMSWRHAIDAELADLTALRR
jgi:hypothetical protein